jgi:hypothetical protein
VLPVDLVEGYKKLALILPRYKSGKSWRHGLNTSTYQHRGDNGAEDERRASVDNTCVQGVGVRGTEASTVNGAWIIRDLVLDILTGKIWLAVGSHGCETRTGDQLSAPGDRMEAGIGWSLEMVAWQDLRFGRRHL